MIKQIFDDILIERSKQDKKHPQLPKYILHPDYDPKKNMFELSLESQRKNNDELEKTGNHSWYGILNEEDAEVFSAKSMEELDDELVQSIALRIRMLERIRMGTEYAY